MTDSGFGKPIRLCEWSSADVELSEEQRRVIEEAALHWKIANNLSQPPLEFTGSQGKTINTREYVGVIEVADVVIEIFPKLDKRLVEKSTVDDEIAGSVMVDLLWLLDISGHFGINEIDDAGIKESPENFFDVFAILMGKHLLAELNVGLPHTYVKLSDDSRMVRGKICLLDQITRNMNRYDLISCEWDEFTPDMPMNQLFKCSCRFLQQHVQDGGAFKVLTDCITQLEDITDVDPLTALTGVMGHRWDRHTERFRIVFDLAKRLLQGCGYMLSAGDATTFVFLLNMNKVFEDYVKAVLEASFNVGIETQKMVGELFPQLPKGRVLQKADYYWCSKDGVFWVGDAKYKHLTKDQSRALFFEQLPDEEGNDYSAPAGSVISPNDIRQLTVYAELVRRNNKEKIVPNILLCYPFIGDGKFASDTRPAWNNSNFTLCPVKMKRQANLKNVLPQDIQETS